MNFRYLFYFVLWGMASGIFGQERPRLVVGIVVDQMRPDYLEKFQHRFVKGGFKRLMNEGFQFTQCHINYFPSYTAPGHASIYTGTTPSIHGIVANEWYERRIEDTLYCVYDNRVNPVGTENIETGRMSPANLYVNTMTDELRMATEFKSKTFGVCIKDRGSILPAGKNPNGAFWFDRKSGNFISSSYYGNDLPEWLKQFNLRKRPDYFLTQNWSSLYPVSTYLYPEDNSPYEGLLSDKEAQPVFPHQLPAIRKEGYDILVSTPFGNTLTRELAEETILQEKMGSDTIPDFLALSFSSTDYIGHLYGINSVEIEDTYLRLDRDLELFFNFLDAKIGKGKYLVFLTADHGAAHNAHYLNDHKIPGGLFNPKEFRDALVKDIKVKYNRQDLIAFYDNQQVYIQFPPENECDLSLFALPAVVGDLAKVYPGVDAIFMAEGLQSRAPKDGIEAMYARGFRPERCGDVFLHLKAGWYESSRKTGTTHGSVHPYDTHIPLIFMGWGVKSGKSTESVSITDIAPTISQLLKIQAPSGTTGHVIYPR